MLNEDEGGSLIKKERELRKVDRSLARVLLGAPLTLGYASAAFAGKNAGSGKPVTVSGITLTGADAGNYTFNATAVTTADITARTLTVTANDASKIYGDTLSFAGTEFTVGGIRSALWT